MQIKQKRFGFICTYQPQDVAKYIAINAKAKYCISVYMYPYDSYVETTISELLIRCTARPYVYKIYMFFVVGISCTSTKTTVGDVMIHNSHKYPCRLVWSGAFHIHYICAMQMCGRMRIVRYTTHIHTEGHSWGEGVFWQSSIERSLNTLCVQPRAISVYEPFRLNGIYICRFKTTNGADSNLPTLSLGGARCYT